jgi:substrate import-associated zinc metallohydrolase lipoprotein
MKTIRYISILLFLGAIALGTNSCREKETIVEDLRIEGLGGYEFPESELDSWLYETFTRPYNIAVYYHWDAVKQIHTFNKKLVPAKEEMIRPMMSALARVWFEPYLICAPYGFLQEVAPKTIVLTGSPEYDNSGAITLGQAEGGRKIWLTSVNRFDPRDEERIKESLHVIEHEFTHVLHQIKKYDPAFTHMTGSFNAGGWQTIEDPEANGNGFISPYAMVNPDEDFAEMVSRVMVYGVDWFENTIIARAADPANGDNPEFAVASLRYKLDYIDRYMMDMWNIRFLDSEEGEPGLVTTVQNAIADLMANP